MAICPLCSERASKRYCPAKAAQICAVCCGTKREIEIDCPGDCPYLKAAQSYEAEKRVPDPDLAAKVHKYDREFRYRYGPILDAISQAVVEERFQSAWLVDNDVVEVYQALRTTMKTLSSGIYYESLPDGPVRISLFRRLKDLLDQLMQPQESNRTSSLKVSEVLDILDFMTLAAQINSSVRPKSRRYLDWLSGMAAPERSQPSQSSGLILP
jgi:hypothetical protein